MKPAWGQEFRQNSYSFELKRNRVSGMYMSFSTNKNSKWRKYTQEGIRFLQGESYVFLFCARSVSNLLMCRTIGE